MVIPHELQQYSRSLPHSDHVRNSRDFVRLKPELLEGKILNISPVSQAFRELSNDNRCTDVER